MKDTFLFIICLAILAQNSVLAQTIRRVNNTGIATGGNIYTSIQTAHDACSAGDIIYIEPSTTTYGDLNVSKRITIYGSGYTNSANANTTYKKSDSVLGTLNLNPGSENTLIYSIKLTANINITAQNITISRCYVNGNIALGGNSSTGYGASNIIIKQCMILDGIRGSNWYIGSVYTNPQNIRIDNNIIRSYYNSSAIYNIGGGSTISNNVLRYGIQYVDNSTLRNNIFTTTGNVEASSSGNSYTHNVHFGSGLGSANGNISSATGVFINGDDPWSNFVDNLFLLSPSSPALAAGSDGTQRGIFGGNSPYVLSGQPPVPIITQLNSTISGNATTPLTVQITVRSNN